MKTKKLHDKKIYALVDLMIKVFACTRDSTLNKQAVVYSLRAQQAPGTITAHNLFNAVAGYDIGFNTPSPTIIVSPTLNQYAHHELFSSLMEVMLGNKRVSEVRCHISEANADLITKELTNAVNLASAFVSALHTCTYKEVVDPTDTPLFGDYSGRDALALSLLVFSMVINSKAYGSKFTFTKFFKHFEVSLFIAMYSLRHRFTEWLFYPEPSAIEFSEFYKDFPTLRNKEDDSQEDCIDSLIKTCDDYAGFALLFYICQ